MSEHFVANRFSEKKIRSAVFFILIFSFVFSCAMYVLFYPGTKKLLLFESLDKNGIYAETCFVPYEKAQSDLDYITAELLLGPKTDRYRPLFSPGTKTLSLFKGRGGTVYVNLNKDALLQNGTASQTLAACKLLERNIRKNCGGTGSVVIAISGRKVYEY